MGFYICVGDLRKSSNKNSPLLVGGDGGGVIEERSTQKHQG
jgi:hypothetical protein